MDNFQSRVQNVNVLYVVLSTKPDCVKNIKTLVSLVNSDHYLLEFLYDFNLSKNPMPDRFVYHWRAVNYDELNYKLSQLDLANIVRTYSFNENILWLKWKEAILSVIE